MAIATPEGFEDALNDAFSWRRTEIQAMKAAVSGLGDSSNHTPHARMILRSSVALLYAHWEGFAKQACQHYLDYVAKRKLKFGELHPELAATALRPLVDRATRGRSELQDVSSVLLRLSSERAQMPRTGVVETGSNLRSDRLSDMLKALGIDAGLYETRQHLIDVRLCDARNEIAHGGFALPDREALVELLEIVLAMMEDLRTQLMNAVALRSYRAS